MHFLVRAVDKFLAVVCKAVNFLVSMEGGKFYVYVN